MFQSNSTVKTHVITDMSCSLLIEILFQLSFAGNYFKQNLSATRWVEQSSRKNLDSIRTWHRLERNAKLFEEIDPCFVGQSLFQEIFPGQLPDDKLDMFLSLTSALPRMHSSLYINLPASLSPRRQRFPTISSTSASKLSYLCLFLSLKFSKNRKSTSITVHDSLN